VSSKVPDEDHVLRFVPHARVKRDADERPIGIFPQSFSHRDNEEYLSVTWLQYFGCGYESAYALAAHAIRSELRVGNKAAFVVAQVSQLVKACAANRVRARVLHEPTDKNPAHCALRGLQKAEDQLLALLAEEIFTDLRCAAEI
jgi:hypothetical protein